MKDKFDRLKSVYGLKEMWSVALEYPELTVEEFINEMWDSTEDKHKLYSEEILELKREGYLEDQFNLRRDL